MNRLLAKVALITAFVNININHMNNLVIFLLINVLNQMLAELSDF